MPFWPFKNQNPEPITPIDLRDKLIEAANSGSHTQLQSVCMRHREQVATHLDVISKIPEEIISEPKSLNDYVQCLVAVAQCLAKECDSPELWQKMSGDPGSNPLMVWDRWLKQLGERTQRLEYDKLIAEAKQFIEATQEVRGESALLYECYFKGRLGQLLFHSGHVKESLIHFQAALDNCLERGDTEGQIAYLGHLSEAHRYLDDGQAVLFAEKLLDAKRASNQSTFGVRKQIDLMQGGDPLCRVVILRDGNELEVDEIRKIGEGNYEFLFRRNRPALQKALRLTELGNEKARVGNFADALENFRDASETDPYDPVPVYQSGMCLLDLGAYDKSRETFEDVERLAPGWFHCRFYRWLADQLEQGLVSRDEFGLLRSLDSGVFSHSDAAELATTGIEKYPNFAPLYWYLGNFSTDGREAAYRKGLELVEEPDLECRLMFSLASTLDVNNPERKQLLERVVKLDGNLVATASAKLIDLR